MTTKDTILARLRLAERDEESIPLGATIRLRELTRAELRDASTFSSTEDAVARERTRGARLATAVDAAQGDADALQVALTAYYLGPPTTATDVDRWHAALLATSAHDPETGERLFTRDEILAWPSRDELWSEARRLVQVALDLSEVGTEALAKSHPADATE